MNVKTGIDRVNNNLKHKSSAKYNCASAAISCSETVQASAKVSTEREYEFICDQSNGVIFHNLE